MSGKTKRRGIKAKYYWILSLIAACAFLVLFFMMPMFPKKWSLFLYLGLLALLGVTAFFSFTRPRSAGIKMINALLAVILAAGAVLLPVYKTRISHIIEENNEGSNKVKVNLYVMSDEYISNHPEAKITLPSPEDKLASYTDSTFITQLSVDSKYQLEALDVLRKDLGKENINLLDKNTLREAAEALYTGEAEVMMMTDFYASMIEDMEGYEDFYNDTKVLYTIEVDQEVVEIKKTDATLTTEPFSVFFGGNDEEGELKLTGRTDVDMIVTVNPVTHQIAICSLPRDSYVPNPALGNRPDKLTHLGINGLDNTLTGLGNLFNTTIENYVLINFTTYMQIIDALGGVDIDNPYKFTYTWDDDYVYDEGMIHLDGQAALYYVRERYSLPDGDFGRNMHQQIVMRAIIEKVASPTVITRFNSLLDALEGTFLTNLSDNSIYSFCQMQLDENIKWNIVNYRAVGEIGMAVCAAAPGQELSVVYPYQNQVEFMAQVIKDVIDGKTVEQVDIPGGYGNVVPPVTLPSTPTPTPEVKEQTQPQQQQTQPQQQEQQEYVPESTPEPTPEPATPEPATPEPSTPEPSTPEPSTPEPATPEPSTPEPSTPEPTPEAEATE